MKKWVVLLAALLALALSGTYLAQAADEREGLELKDGKYVIGDDIEPGTYTLSCTGTAGERLSDAYSSLGDAFDALDDSNEYGSLFGMLGGIAEECVDMTVEILGDYGDVLESWTLKTGESMRIELEAETALQITDGNCTLVPEE